MKLKAIRQAVSVELERTVLRLVHAAVKREDARAPEEATGLRVAFSLSEFPRATADEVAHEIRDLVSALSEIHILNGGRGLVLDDLDVAIPLSVLESV